MSWKENMKRFYCLCYKNRCVFLSESEDFKKEALPEKMKIVRAFL